jgi:hypothetical protein
MRLLDRIGVRDEINKNHKEFTRQFRKAYGEGEAITFETPCGSPIPGLFVKS